MYPCFDVGVEIVWSYVSDSYAGGSVATGRACHARQIKGDDIGKKGFPVRPFWGLVVRLTSSHKICTDKKLPKLETGLNTKGFDDGV
jgi:hypothetical protein